jgi:tetratricopeptide (TPR) repeat protein
MNAFRKRCASFVLAGLLCCVLCGSSLYAQTQDPQFAAAQALLGQQRWKEAAMAFDSWVSTHPDSTAGLQFAANAWMRLHRFDRGAERLQRALQLAPGTPGLLFDLGICLQNQARWSEALPIWKELIAASGADPKINMLAQIPYAMGIAAERLDLQSEALDGLGRAVSMEPANQLYRREYAGTLLEADRFAEALAEYQELLRRFPTATEHSYLAGVAALRAGNDALAESLLRDARRKDTSSAQACAKLAQIYQRQGKSDLAHSLYLEALEKNPRSAEALHALHRIAQAAGDSDSAADYQRRFEEVRKEEDAGSERLRALKRRLKASRTDVDALQEQASLHLSERKFDRAMECYAQILHFKPDNEIAVLNMAALLSQRGEHFAALCELDRILESKPGHAFAGLERTRLLVLRKDWAGGLAASRAALPAMPASDPRALDLVELMAECAHQSKQPGDVVAVLRNFLPQADAPRVPRFALRAFQFLAMEGKAAEAIPLLEDAFARTADADPLKKTIATQLAKLHESRGDEGSAARWRTLAGG